MPSPGIILLHLSGQLQAEEHASYAQASLGDRTSPMWAASLAASAGATRENSTVTLGFSSPKEFGVMFGCWVFQLQLGMPGIPAGG